MEIYNPQPQKEKIEKLTISIKEAAQILGISYNVMLTLVHRKDFPKILAGQR
ncbi:MerR family transcriptional regulator [Caldicellulosiruptor hydrothermalis]|uniref:ethanolamine utilization protein EutA n=1 Tax=Caldicellulosiruptor hydrothermalis TaxID=413888 RepID=UPI000303CA63|nr:ethanolamine utilization protein EutA [Caldicellulosiruptor hydrothermalis]